MQIVTKPLSELTPKEWNRCSRQNYGINGDMYYVMREQRKDPRSKAIMLLDDDGKQVAWALGFYSSKRARKMRAMFWVTTRNRKRGYGTMLMDEVQKMDRKPWVYPHSKESAALFKKYRSNITPVYGVHWLNS